MTTHNHPVLGAGGAITLALAATTSGAEPLYVLTEIVAPIDHVLATEPGGINDSGQVTAYAHVSEKPVEVLAFTVDASGYTTLLGLSGTTCAVTMGIEGGGRAFGYCLSNPALSGQATLWDVNGRAIDLGTLAGHDGSMALDADTAGRIVGESSWAPGLARPVLWENGSIVELDTAGFKYGSASGIAAVGERIVGTVWNDPPGFPGNTQGFVFAFDGFWSIGTLPSGTFSRLVAVNDSGEAIGSADDEGLVHALRYDDRGLVGIEPLPGDFHAEFLDINDRGVAVGFSGERAVVAFGDELLDLNGLLLDSAEGWALEEATAINEYGEILGRGMNPDGVPATFVLTPLP